MATIPTYNRSVNPQAAPDVRISNPVTAETMGAGVFKAVGNAGKQLQEYQDRQDTADVISAKSELQGKINALLYDKENGLMFKEGSQARGVGDAFNKEFDTNLQDIRSKLNKRAQQAFDQYTASYRNSLTTHVTEHEVKQNEVALDESFKNLTYTTAQAINQPGAYRNPDLVNQLVTEWELGAKARYHKKDTGTINRVISQGKSEFLKAALNTLYKQDDIDGVKSFIELYKDKMEPDDLAPYQGWIEKKEERFQARTVADTLFNTFGLDNEKAAISELKKQYGNKPWFEQAQNFLEDTYRDNRRFKEQDDKKYKEDIYLQLMTAGSNAEVEQILSGSKLTPTERRYAKANYATHLKTKPEKLVGEAKWAFNYQTNGGLSHDMRLMQEKLEIETSDKELTPEQKTKYMDAEFKLNRYKMFHGTGGYGMNEPPEQGVSEFKRGEDSNTGQDNVDKWIDKARTSGADPEWIKQKLKEKGYEGHISHVW